ncbi:12088_t:CDS:2 [Funneliformis caledonium]|uniref:12088_t:CDS:1 n=1 Tax=Funneliformis caledonium TaxID=1117310 RepID=A0A9N8Z2C7_9GLOM|nr:12088_t:CDS:2 [Funneliformis caledonium]
MNSKELTFVSAPINYNLNKVDIKTIVTGLITLLVKAINEGKSRDLRHSILRDYLSLHKFTIEEIYDWLCKDEMTNLDLVFLKGYLNFSGFGKQLNVSEAFNYFDQSSSRKHPISQYYIGICYEFGLGTTIDKRSAITTYEESAKKAIKRLEKLSEASLLEYGEKKVEVLTEQQIIQRWKLNHGLFLDGPSIQTSKKVVFVDDGDLDINLYQGEPIVYININDPDCLTNSLDFENHKVEVYDNLKSSDLCINFPVVEITYRADPVNSFSKFTGKVENLHDLYGHFIANKFLAGGQLFIKNFNLTSSSQKDILKFYLVLVYNSAKNNNEFPFDNSPFDLDFFPRIETSDGLTLDTLKKLVNWMRKLYQDNIIDIISYINLNSTSQLKSGISAKGLEIDKHTGIANYREEVNFENWVGNTEYVKLAKWIKNFHLFQGLAINKSYKIESSKKFAIKFKEVPEVNLRDESYFEIINPTTKLEEIFIFNKIFSVNNSRTFPFIKLDDFKNMDYIHLVVKYEKYEILINRDHIEPSEEFNSAIDKALNEIKPLIALRGVFDEYGHVFPLRIILGKSLKNISTTNFFGDFKKINLKLPITSLRSYLNKLNISYLTTQNGDIIEDYDNCVQKSNNDLEIIEYDEVISLYDILESEQKKKVDCILSNNLKIIMTGINDLKDLDKSNVQHYKRINLDSSLEDENYEVFGSIITKKYLKSKDFFVRFRLFDVNGFSAIIKPLKKSKVDIRRCYISWMIIGNPMKLSVFSPNNRNIQVDRIEESIALKAGISNYRIKTLPLSKGNVILINVYYPSTNYEPLSIIKFDNWEDEAINVELIYDESSLDSSKVLLGENNKSLANIETTTKIDIHICILRSDSVSLKVDNHEKERNLDLFGYILTKDNLNEKFHELDKFDSIKEIINQPFINDDVQQFLSKGVES